MGLQGINEFMEALIALPDRLDVRLAVSRTGSEAPALGQAPHHAVRPPHAAWHGRVTGGDFAISIKSADEPGNYGAV